MHIDHLQKAGNFKKLSKEVADAYTAWHKTVFGNEKLFDKKTMELFALCASCAIKCSYCIESHSQKAREFGATEDEITKVVQIASVTGSGSVISYGIEALSK